MNKDYSEGKPVYSAFAEIYDQVMRDVDYDTWSQYVLSLADLFQIQVHKILDLACGSGSLAIRLSKMGYDVIGVDFSEAMLLQAERKFKEEEVDIPLYQGTMYSFSHRGIDRDFDLVTCLYDSLNYLLEPEKVKNCFAEVYDHLRPGGAFIFDVTTEYNLLHNFAGYTFAENFESASYIWENEYNIEKKVCISKVNIFLYSGSSYKKYVEVHVQRVYPTSLLADMLSDTRFELLGTFHNITMEPVRNKCERIHFVCKKPER